MTKITDEILRDAIVSEARRVAEESGKPVQAVHFHAARANIGRDLDREFQFALIEHTRHLRPASRSPDPTPASEDGEQDERPAPPEAGRKTRAARVGKPKLEASTTSEEAAPGSDSAPGDEAASA